MESKCRPCSCFWLLVLVLHQAVIASAQTGSVSIDCGESKGTTDSNGIKWLADEGYTAGGETATVADKFSTSYSPAFRSLRRFPNGRKNCYGVPVTKGVKYSVKSVFFYGNYDGLSSPPQFRLIVDANEIDTVKTEVSKPVYLELIMTAAYSNISLCLGLLSRDQVPFISALEVFPLSNLMHSEATPDMILYADQYYFSQSEKVISYPDDKYGRIWEPVLLENVTMITTTKAIDISSSPEYPPSSAMQSAASTLMQQSVELNLAFYEKLSGNQTGGVYFNLYFAELQNLATTNDTRMFNILIDGKIVQSLVSSEYLVASKFKSFNQIYKGSLNLTLVSTSSSTLGPIANAIDMFVIHGTATGTFEDDVIALQDVKQSLNVRKWIGDPCTPIGFTWDKVTCNSESPPKVIGIDLSNMNLTGTIPEAFANLSSLKTLNLANNDLFGEIPLSLQNLVTSKTLSIDFSGNQFLCSIWSSCGGTITPPANPKSSSKTMMIAIVASVIIVLIIVSGIVILICCRKKSCSSDSNPVKNMGTQNNNYDQQYFSKGEEVCLEATTK